MAKRARQGWQWPVVVTGREIGWFTRQREAELRARGLRLAGQEATVGFMFICKRLTPEELAAYPDLEASS